MDKLFSISSVNFSLIIWVGRGLDPLGPPPWVWPNKVTCAITIKSTRSAFSLQAFLLPPRVILARYRIYNARNDPWWRVLKSPVSREILRSPDICIGARAHSPSRADRWNHDALLIVQVVLVSALLYRNANIHSTSRLFRLDDLPVPLRHVAEPVSGPAGEPTVWMPIRGGGTGGLKGL